MDDAAVSLISELDYISDETLSICVDAIIIKYGRRRDEFIRKPQH